MCRAHLLGEHGELHKHRHCFEKGYRMAGRRGQIELVSMQKRHDELAAEMERRGYNHASPFIQPNIAYLPPEDLHGVVDREAALKDLLGRCEHCRELAANQQRGMAPVCGMEESEWH